MKVSGYFKRLNVAALVTAASVLVAEPTGWAQTLGNVAPATGQMDPMANQMVTFDATFPALDTTSPELDVSIGNSGGSVCSFSYSYTSGFSASAGICGVSFQFGSWIASMGQFQFTVYLTFPSSVAGQTFYYIEQAVDNATSQTSGWWQIPGASISITGLIGPVQLGTVTPAAGSGPANQAATLSFTASSPEKWYGSTEIDVLISPDHTQTNACLITFIPGMWEPYLFSDDLSSWSYVWLGYSGWNTSNSQCQVNGGGSGYLIDGTGANITVNYNLQFTPSFVGLNYIDEYISDPTWNTSAGWGQIGTYTVQGNPIITTSCADLPLGVVEATPQYSYQLTAQGSKLPNTWSLQSGSLPPGLGLSTGGLLSGTPTQTGTFGFAIGVKDAANYTAVSPLTCSINVIAQDQMVTQTSNVITKQAKYMPATQVGVFRAGVAFLEDSNGNAAYDGDDRFITNFTGPGGYQSGDYPVVGDWTGDGVAKVGIYRSTGANKGTWYLDANNNGIYDTGDLTYSFGGIEPQNPGARNYIPGDVPVVGDWSGLGKDCVGVFRQGFFWVLDLNCDGAFNGTQTDAAFGFGGVGLYDPISNTPYSPNADRPVVGKWIGSTTPGSRPRTRVGVVRGYIDPGTRVLGLPFYWILDGGDAISGDTTNGGNSPKNHQPDCGGYTNQPLNRCFAFGGIAGDVFVTGDWAYNGAGNGTSAAGVYRTAIWVLDYAPPGASQAFHLPGVQLSYGGAVVDVGGVKIPDVPVTGTWSPLPSIQNQTSWPTPASGGSGSTLETQLPFVAPPCTTPLCSTYPQNATFKLAVANLPQGQTQTVTFQPCYLALEQSQSQPPPSPSANCQTASTGNPISISPSTYTFSASDKNHTFTASVPAYTVPSSFNGYEWSDPSLAYQVSYAVACTPTHNCPPGGVIPVYVTAPPAKNITITANVNIGDVYGYNGQTDPRNGTSAPFPAATPGCPVGSISPDGLTWTVRKCYQDAFSRWSKQGVTGITITMLPCSSEFGNGILLGCDTTTPTIDPKWAGYFEMVLQDLAANNITSVALRVGLGAGQMQGTEDSNGAVQINCGSDQSSYPLQYQPSGPFPAANGAIYGARNDGYWCFPSNPDSTQPGWGPKPLVSILPPVGYEPSKGTGNFVGWALILKAFDVVFHQMSITSNTLASTIGTYNFRSNRAFPINLESVDLSSESSIADGETIRMRVIYDPFHRVNLNTPTAVTLPVAWSSCGLTGPTDNNGPVGTDVLGWLRCLATYYHFDPGGITISNNERQALTDNKFKADTGVPTPPTLSDVGNQNCGTQQSNVLLTYSPTTYYDGIGVPYLRGPTTNYGICCPNRYGDDSRADNLTMFLQGLLGNQFGDTADPTYGDFGPNGSRGRSFGTDDGFNLDASGLYCLLAPGRTSGKSPGPLTTLRLSYSYLPRIFDMHSYPRLLASDGSTRDPNYLAFTAREARTSVAAFQDVINRYAPGRVISPQLQISETHSTTNVTQFGKPNSTCESGDPYQVAWLAFLGERQSTAALPGLIVRPWGIWDSCVPIVPNSNFFFNGLNTTPVVFTNGYDKNQP